MILEINKLYNSNYTYFQDIGRFLYFRNLENGLSEDEVIELLELLAKNESIETELNKKEFEEGKRLGYEEGYESGREDCNC